MNKKVSIIIPTHSGHNVVSRAVESALNQTYDNIEVIVVDDNGKATEEQIMTENEIKKFLNDSRFKYIVHEQSKHGSAARNTGVKNSTGNYIALLDDDDYFVADNIFNHIETIESCNEEYGISYCGLHLVYLNIEEDIIPIFSGNVIIDFLLGKIYIGSSQILIKRNVWDEFGGFDESYKRHQDWEFLARVFSKYKLANVGKIGVVKINIDRNNPETAERYEAFRLYYLDKNREIIDSIPQKLRIQVYNNHYIDIAKSYLKHKNFFKCLYWCNRTSNPIKSIFVIICSFGVYIKKHILNLKFKL